VSFPYSRSVSSIQQIRNRKFLELYSLFLSSFFFVFGSTRKIEVVVVCDSK
jgi:hypothetical protein